MSVSEDPVPYLYEYSFTGNPYTRIFFHNRKDTFFFIKIYSALLFFVSKPEFNGYYSDKLLYVQGSPAYREAFHSVDGSFLYKDNSEYE
jgi:hypothetical protein